LRFRKSSQEDNSVMEDTAKAAIYNLFFIFCGILLE